MQRLFVIFTLASCIVALFDDLHLPDNPVYYKEYHRQCGVPLKCASDWRCPNVYNWKHLELWAQQEAINRFEWESSFQNNPCYLVSEKEYDFNLFFTNALDFDDEIGVKNTLTTDILLQHLASQGKCTVRNLLEGYCPNVNRSLSLDKCQHRKAYDCDPNYPYRTYNGVCNNLRHTTWGQSGNPLKLEMAPCFDDFVSKHRMSTSGRSLPNNRNIISDIQRAKNSQGTVVPPTAIFNIFGLIFSEFVTSDMVGRAMKRTRNATSGFRGCRADGSDVSLFRAPLTEPLHIFNIDPNYGPKNVKCLNFSPIENANDQCDIRYPSKRSIATSYLDMSSTYGEGKYDSTGKLVTSFCEASSTFGQSHVITIQFLAVAGLFSQLHNYCIDRVSLCGQGQSKEDMIEKCRSLTIGVYQRIVYEELLLALFGEEFYSQCNFDCEYDEGLESSISSTYTNALGRFQHIWMPENFTLVEGNDRIQKSVPEFFLNLETYDCSMVLEGTFDDPIRIQTLSESVN
ncbi:chorion peroxidase-like [Ochlerotatus camptorhynchus]|uniref:chorion peroxidase-like n=1 Tax=Ochlerotatus camptorhynchus TaxID=644619 RepID=UPI0031D4D92E